MLYGILDQRENRGSFGDLRHQPDMSGTGIGDLDYDDVAEDLDDDNGIGDNAEVTNNDE